MLGHFKRAPSSFQKGLWTASGLAVFFILFFGVFSHALPAVRKMDLDGDGTKEADVFFSGSKIVMATLDRNGDGVPDGTVYYKNGFRDRAELDANFDGKVETWIEYYFTGVPAEIRVDRNQNGRPDAWRFFKNGFIYKKEWDRNGDGIADYRMLYEIGPDYRPVISPDGKRTLEKRYDNDFDGTFEKTIKVRQRILPKRVRLAAGDTEEIDQGLGGW